VNIAAKRRLLGKAKEAPPFDAPLAMAVSMMPGSTIATRTLNGLRLLRQ